ncbi:hypothetical protein HA402_012989 [Bradysia odoriphaga]|nr:hypothetical protein HA402_012989 [Bradysia odoriphaga]
MDDFLVNYEQEEEELITAKFEQIDKVTAVIIPTSGTTGMPKLICLSHAMVLSHFFRPIVHYDSYELISLNNCPMFWISGVVASLQDLTELRTRIVTNLKSTPESIIELSLKYNVTDVFCNSAQFTGCAQLLQKIKTELPTIRAFSASGTTVPYHCVVELRKYLPNGYCMSGYGLSELAGIISIDIFGPEGSVGLLTKGMKLRIKDEDGRLLGPNETGYVWAKCESEFLDYLNNEPPRHLKFDNEGFINSFDIGYFDDDGFLYVTGRREDMLEFMHQPVYSTKIETILLSHPDVIDVCVVGVRVPPYFDIPTAIVVIEADSKITAEDIHLWIKDKLPSDLYKLRGGIYFVDELPRTITGRVKKHLVKMQAFELYHESGTKIEDFKY